MVPVNLLMTSDASALKELNLPPVYNGDLFRSPLVSVYYHRQPAFSYLGQRYNQFKSVLSFEPASGIIGRKVAGAWSEERFVGRGVHCIPPGIEHDMQWEREAEFIEVYFESDFLLSLPPEKVAAVLARPSLPEAANDPVIWDLAVAICLWCADAQPEPSIISDIGVLIGKRLFHNHAEARDGTVGPRLSHEQRRKLEEFIQVNIANPFSVRDLARVVALSAPHLTTLCRNTTGKPPMEYVRECRLRKAHAMARSGKYRRGEIARHCGFYDGSHLNREFKKFFKHPVVSLL